jgi:hypothetical protein
MRRLNASHRFGALVYFPSSDRGQRASQEVHETTSTIRDILRVPARPSAIDRTKSVIAGSLNISAQRLEEARRPPREERRSRS